MFPAVVTTNDRLRSEHVDTMNQEEENDTRSMAANIKGGWVDDTPRKMNASKGGQRGVREEGWSRWMSVGRGRDE